MPSINYRRCVSCRRIGSKESFWRIVRLAGDKTIQLDRGMGRSAYLCANAQCLQQAKTKNRLSGSLRTKVPPSVYQNLQARLDQ